MLGELTGGGFGRKGKRSDRLRNGIREGTKEGAGGGIGRDE